MLKRIFALVLTLMLALPACAETPPEWKDAGLDLLGSSVHYPQWVGLPDEALQASVNAALMEAGRIEDRLSRMAMLASSPVKLNVSYRCALVGDVYSCAFLADGAVTNSRATQVWTAANIDLTTGEAVPFDALFADSAAARAHIEGVLGEQVAPDLSAHLEAGLLTPLPEVFFIDETGLTLYYPIDSFRTLSDRAGTVTLRWYEVEDHLAPWLADLVLPESADLAALTAGGTLPGIPAALGDSVQALTDRYALLSDPDEYEGGRMIALEDGAFRQAWILTDALTADNAQSVVQGIRADRMALGPIVTGRTTAAEWRAILGDPETTLTVDADRADAWRIVPGSSDYYALDGLRLRLHADEGGVLRSVFITE